MRRKERSGCGWTLIALAVVFWVGFAFGVAVAEWARDCPRAGCLCDPCPCAPCRCALCDCGHE